MTGQPGHEGGGRKDAGGHGSDERLNPEGAGMGMGDEATTFEPEETPEAVDDPDEGATSGADPSGEAAAVEPRELVPEEERVDEAEAPREVLPDAERAVEDQEAADDRLLPDEERPVPGGPDDI